MICRYFILTLAFLLPNWALSQDRETNVASFLRTHEYQKTHDVRYSNLEKKANRLIRKNAYIGKSKSLRQYRVFIFVTGSMITTKDYRDGKFLDYLWCQSHSRQRHLNRALQTKREYMSALTLITDSLGNLVADYNGDDLITYPPYNIIHEGRQEIAKMFFNREIDFAFIFWGDPQFYICIKGNDMSVLDASGDKPKRMSWDEFVDTYIVNGFPKSRTPFLTGRLAD